jgi:hypothetical protein
MKPIAKTVTQEVRHELKQVTYIINKDNVFNQLRISIFVNGEFFNDVDAKNLTNAKDKVKRYTSQSLFLF